MSNPDLQAGEYTSRDEIASIFSETGVDTHLDDNDTNAVDSNGTYDEEMFLIDVIQEATDTINQYLLPYYYATDMESSRWVRRRASWIASYYLSQRRGNAKNFMDRFEQIMEDLKKMALEGPGINGSPLIPNLALRADHRPAHSNLVIDDRFPFDAIRVIDESSSGYKPPTRSVAPVPWYKA